MPEEEFNKLKAFVTRYIIAYSEDVSQPKPLARYIDQENLYTYPQPPQEYGGCTRAELEQIETE